MIPNRAASSGAWPLARRLCLALAWLPALAAACAPAGPCPLPNPEPMRRYLALGDSYTIGQDVSASERWPSQLAAGLRAAGYRLADPVIVARTGWTTDELDAALNRTPPEGRFDLVSLLIGVNNQYRGRPVDEYRLEFAALLERAVGWAGGRANRVLVLSIPDWGVTPFGQGRDASAIRAAIDAFNAANKAAAEARGAHYVDVTGLSRQAAARPNWLAGDGLHPSGAMYAAWAERALPEACAALGP